MPETIRCPGCGTANDAGAEACVQCNFPLRDPAAAPAPGGRGEEGGRERPAAATFSIGPPPMRRRRPRPDAMQPIQMQLWLFTGIAVVMGIVYFAGQGFLHSNTPPVAGAAPDQQARADSARVALARDSTNLEARIELANVLYDTGNWSEAIVHYRSAERLQPARSTTVVDLGVCYYNLGAFAAAESLFRHAIALDPHQAVAMFNLGIIAETRGRWDEAIEQFHRALETGPPDVMQQAIQEHIQKDMEKSGKSPKPPRS